MLVSPQDQAKEILIFFMTADPLCIASLLIVILININLKKIFGERDFKIEILNQSINFKPIEWQQVK